jgi:hypothetical protein
VLSRFSQRPSELVKVGKESFFHGLGSDQIDDSPKLDGLRMMLHHATRDIR